jgi:hypothetical protein
MIENSTVRRAVVSTHAKWYNGGPLVRSKAASPMRCGNEEIATGSFAKPESLSAEIETHVTTLSKYVAKYF